MLSILLLLGASKGIEVAINFHNDFMRKYRQAQKEGRL